MMMRFCVAQAMLGVESAQMAGFARQVPWALIVPVREPVSHYLSWYYYFGEPDSHLSIPEWAATGHGCNGAVALILESNALHLHHTCSHIFLCCVTSSAGL